MGSASGRRCRFAVSLFELYSWTLTPRLPLQFASVVVIGSKRYHYLTEGSGRVVVGVCCAHYWLIKQVVTTIGTLLLILLAMKLQVLRKELWIGSERTKQCIDQVEQDKVFYNAQAPELSNVPQIILFITVATI